MLSYFQLTFGKDEANAGVVLKNASITLEIVE